MHADVLVSARDRSRLERLCRHMPSLPTATPQPLRHSLTGYDAGDPRLPEAAFACAFDRADAGRAGACDGSAALAHALARGSIMKGGHAIEKEYNCRGSGMHPC